MWVAVEKGHIHMWVSVGNMAYKFIQVSTGAVSTVKFIECLSHEGL
jgi:hypothetical protein